MTAVISLAGTNLGPSLGNASLGVLYCVYTLTAAFGSHGAVRALGAKKTLFLGAEPRPGSFLGGRRETSMLRASGDDLS